MRFDAAILDMDGVLTDTAHVHERAWKETFDPLLREKGIAAPFSSEDYRLFVDGKPRIAGARDFLASRGLELSPAELESLGERKNVAYQKELRGGVENFDDAVRALQRWRQHGLALAFISASRNARDVLEEAGLTGLSDVCIDGIEAANSGLPGKLEMLREAVRRLGTEASKAFVVEDAPSGIEAAARSEFALVIGMARNGNAQPLLDAGAHRVIRHFDELTDVIEPGSRPAAQLPLAFGADVLANRIGFRRPILLLDFDGTLSPIVDQPDAAAIDDPMRQRVAALAKRCTVAIVSGRDREDVTRRVGLPDLWYAGSHGFDVLSPEGKLFTPGEAAPAREELERLESTIREQTKSIEGIVIEKKAFAIAVHYRLASDDDAGEAIRLIQSLARESEHLTTHSDILVIELRPKFDWHKGRAIEQMLVTLEADERETVPLYIGDGRTDEDAFLALREKGIGILVGSPNRPTHAHLRVESQDDVADLLELIVALLDASSARDEQWRIRFEGWQPDQERLREALCTLGNGKFATRGAAEEAQAGEIHYPGTYLAGGYDRIATELEGEVLVNEDLVNWPNWLSLTFRPAGGEWFSLASFEPLRLEQVLDIRRGSLRRRLHVRDREGRETEIVSSRIVSMDDPDVAAIEWTLTPLNWSGGAEIRSSIDGTVRNAGVARYGKLRGDHLVVESTGTDGDAVWLVARTRQSGIVMAQLARTRLSGSRLADSTVESHGDRIDQRFEVELEEGQPLRVEKIVLVRTSRDSASSHPLDDARERIPYAVDLAALRAAHEARWGQLWHRCDIRLGEGQAEETRILRLHVFHLLQVASPHIIDRDAGVPARGLHGEAYRGHIFWDELFIFPFLNFRLPQLTRELLMYRYRRLDAARRIAHDLGYEGVVFPWQSGSSGREESQLLHLNPRSGRWIPDETLRQRHIGAAVAWNVWQYYKTTEDKEFLSSYGAEMLIEIARFWASIASWDSELERFRIMGVMGPDEFHTRYPGADQPGLDDNAYTNVMAAWCLRTAERALGVLPDDRVRELLERFGVDGEERIHWQRIASRLRVVFQGERIISQFDGYEELEEFDWDAYRSRYDDIQRLDRILEAEGDTPNRYKASKQADVLMLFFLFTPDEIVEQFASMGYIFEKEWIAENIDYYLSRTSHGSTLSHVIHSWVLARHDRAHSWRLFQDALRADVEDIQGGTTPEGIHLGAMAATVDLVQRGYTGARIHHGVLWLDPCLPDEMNELTCRLRFRGAWIDLRIQPARLEASIAAGEPPVRLGFDREIYELQPGETLRLDRRLPSDA